MVDTQYLWLLLKSVARYRLDSNDYRWFHCDHVAPVFEVDILRSEVLFNHRENYEQFSILDLTVEVFAESETLEKEERKVLDWRFGVVSKG